jgi:hypothetical protein
MDQITLSTQLVNSILQYLCNRPWAEVDALIKGIQKEAEKKPESQNVEKMD